MGTLKKWPVGKVLLFPNFENEKTQDHQTVGEFCKRPQKKGSYDSNFVQQILYLSPRCKFLKQEVKFKILGQRHKYGYLKHFAISSLEANLENQFKIFSRMTACPEISQDLTHDIFSWNWTDFLLRRKLKDFVWVDVLLRMESNCLHAYKYRKDLEQLQLFLEKIFDGLFSDIGDEDIDINEHVEKPIEDAKKALLTIDYAEDELKTNSKELKHIQFKELVLRKTQRFSSNATQKHQLQHRLSNNMIYDPMETRYQLKWMQTVVKQEQLKLQKAVAKCENEIANCRRQLNFEKYIDDSYMDYCYSSIEVYKNRITELQGKFEKSSDEMENKITHLRLKIEQVMGHRNFLSDEIERFHKEEEEMFLRLQSKTEESKNLSKRKSTPPVTKKKSKKTEKKGKSFKSPLKK